VVGAQQLLRLLLYDLLPFFIELPSSLMDRPDLGVHGEALAQEVWVYACMSESDLFLPVDQIVLRA